eukprot:12146450-Ditylum_brightwellii.AAC.2
MALTPMSTCMPITYKYQAFTCLQIVPPRESLTGSHCDFVDGHSIGYVNFHTPLTPAYRTNALYTKNYP